MYSLLVKRGQLFAIILGLIVVVAFLGSVISGLNGAGYDMGTDLNQVLKNDPSIANFFNVGVYATLGLILIALTAAVFFGLYQMLTNIKGSLTGIIALAVIVGLFFAFYSSMSDDLTGPIASVLQQFDVSSGISKMISGGIATTLLLLVGAFVIAVILEIWNMFK